MCCNFILLITELSEKSTVGSGEAIKMTFSKWMHMKRGREGGKESCFLCAWKVRKSSYAKNWWTDLLLQPITCWSRPRRRQKQRHEAAILSHLCSSSAAYCHQKAFTICDWKVTKNHKERPTRWWIKKAVNRWVISSINSCSAPASLKKN